MGDGCVLGPPSPAWARMHTRAGMRLVKGRTRCVAQPRDDAWESCIVRRPGGIVRARKLPSKWVGAAGLWRCSCEYMFMLESSGAGEIQGRRVTGRLSLRTLFMETGVKPNLLSKLRFRRQLPITLDLHLLSL